MNKQKLPKHIIAFENLGPLSGILLVNKDTNRYSVYNPIIHNKMELAWKVGHLLSGYGSNGKDRRGKQIVF